MSANQSIAEGYDFRTARAAYRDLQDATRAAVTARKTTLRESIERNESRMAKIRTEIVDLPRIIDAQTTELRALEELGESSLIGLIACAVDAETASR